MINIWVVIALVAYVICGFGFSNLMDTAGIERPKILNVIAFPLILIIFAFADLKKWVGH